MNMDYKQEYQQQENTSLTSAKIFLKSLCAINLLSASDKWIRRPRIVISGVNPSAGARNINEFNGGWFALFETKNMKLYRVFLKD